MCFPGVRASAEEARMHEVVGARRRIPRGLGSDALPVVLVPLEAEAAPHRSAICGPEDAEPLVQRVLMLRVRCTSARLPGHVAVRAYGYSWRNPVRAAHHRY